MKTTFDLPPDLVRAVKLRAVHEGRKTDLLKRGLAGPETPVKPHPARPKIEIQANGLPVVRCAADAPVRLMSAGELLALEQAYLAAFAIRHDAEFVTLDQDFRNFEKDGLKLRLLN